MDTIDAGIFNSDQIPLLGQSEVTRYAERFSHLLDSGGACWVTEAGMATRIVEDIVQCGGYRGSRTWGAKVRTQQNEVFKQRFVPLVIDELESQGYLVKDTKAGRRVYPNPARLVFLPEVKRSSPDLVQVEII